MSRRDEVLQAAVELLDEVGLDALTTRRLAAKLGVQAGALYRHFASKQALLDAVVGHLIDEAADGTPELTGEWDHVLRVMAFGMRSAMLAHRDGARLMTTFQVPSAAGEQAFNRTIELLVEAGLTAEAAVSAVDTLFAYVNGFTIEEQARGGDRDLAFRAGVELILAGIRAGLP
ncbi:TetR/AcrR family transcriptional regulator C-terminal domain-containing protein [Fodinicola acaciae]|uniref:TetR/AcrR family transcriptional regulator C-terminal domain-containing protein n=1 Tax=Fodinicola acaciae TaxID=2681555 RepID=UPI0013D5168A|nr:TetR/AcrR family transcriptional regulator C-terminal domain-containing protein [Fodinicola acaciae]